MPTVSALRPLRSTDARTRVTPVTSSGGVRSDAGHRQQYPGDGGQRSASDFEQVLDDAVRVSLNYAHAYRPVQ